MRACRPGGLLLSAFPLVLTLAGRAPAVPLTNHARDRPYTVDPAPVKRYADSRGPEGYRPETAYRGELTDGVKGKPDYRDSAWVGWRDTSYTEPVSVAVDLGGPKWVDRIEVTVCGGPHGVEPPARVDVAIRSPSFPLAGFVQVGQMKADAPYEPGPGRVYRFVLGPCGWEASVVRLNFQERTWQYLFVDEVRVWGGVPGRPGILPVEDVTIEAEAGQVRGGGIARVKGAFGSAVLLAKPGAAVDFRFPLPPGDYTVRVRSLAETPDTYSELRLRADDALLRSQAVTNQVFTWQRSHFTRKSKGAVSLSLSLVEGPGMYIDRIRVHMLTLNEPITQLRAFSTSTRLTADGECRFVLAVDDAGRFEKQAEKAAAEIERRSGVRPTVKRGTQVTAEDFQSRHVVALGDRFDNFAILSASPNAWNMIPPAPDDGGPQVYVCVDPKGAGKNVVVLGGTNAVQVEASVKAFLARVKGGRDLTLPWTGVPPPSLASPRRQYEQLAVESSKWLRQGAIRQLLNQWKAHPDDAFLLLGYRFLEYKDSRDTIAQVPGDGFIEAELFKILCRFDRSEHTGAFTRLQRLQLTNLLWHMAKECAGIFDWNCAQEGGKKGYHSPGDIDRILAARRPTIANNHQTFPAYSLLTAGDYFHKYYHVPEAARWLRWVDLFMKGQLLTAKPQCDCWGYQDITMIHTARYAAATGRWDYFRSGPLFRFLTLRFISHDNLGGGVGYGDVGAYRIPGGPDFLDANARVWSQASAGRLEVGRLDPQKLLGVYVHPLEPLWYDFFGKKTPVPRDKCFDKITFRNAIDPQQAYLLLDGLSRGYHGHWDGNSILRFTDDGRMWLCEGDYLKGDPKDHNTMTFMRNAGSARPGMFSSLESVFLSPTWGTTCTRTDDYCGLDWERRILWFRPADLFFLVDEVTAEQPGTYDLKCRFRSLGDTRLQNRTWVVTQKGGRKFFLHAPGNGRLSEATDPEDAKNWKNYPFADPVPRLLRDQVVRKLKPGERVTLFHVFYAGDAQGNPKLTTARVGPEAIATAGRLRAFVGVHGFRGNDVRCDATEFVLGPDYVLLVHATELTGEQHWFAADHPVSLSFDVKKGVGVLEATAPARLTFFVGRRGKAVVAGRTLRAAPRDGVVRVAVPAGRHELRGRLFAGCCGFLEADWVQARATQRRLTAPRRDHGLAPVFSWGLPAEITALTVGDLDGDGVKETLAGCADGTVMAAAATGRRLWTKKFSARVNDLATADLDGDGKAEAAVGVEDSHLYVLGPDGTELWRHFFEAYRSEGGREGHVRVVLPADFDGDGKPEVAVGCANTKFYVLDRRGAVKRSKGRDWVVSTRHSASALGAADVTGDGQLELFCGYTYFGRALVDFADTGKRRVSNLGGCISGCGSITAADVDGDGRPEAIFADRDGQLTACRKAKPGQRAVDIVWQKMIGDDAIVKVLATDLDGDGRTEIVVASHSGFLAVLSAAGEVRWLRYADNQVTDALVLRPSRRHPAVARSSADGTVVVYDAAGKELARWTFGGPVSHLAAVAVGGSPVLIAAQGKTLRAVAFHPGKQGD